ncbi:MAG: L-talarate dehydratase @ Galactarate dehydratase, partial [uncultured Chloroflexi bacterium]
DLRHHHRARQPRARLRPPQDAHQRRQGLHRPAAPAHAGGHAARPRPGQRWARRPRLQLLQACGRPRPLRPRTRDRPRPHRRGSERHRPSLGEAPVGRRLGRPRRPRRPGHRRLRRRAVGPHGHARITAAGQAARRTHGI